MTRYRRQDEPALPRVADPVRRLRGVAAERIAGRAVGAAAGLLAEAIGRVWRRWSCPRIIRGRRSHRIGAPSRFRGPAGAGGSTPATEPPRGRDAAHDPAGRVPDTAGAVQRAGGHCRRSADCRPAARRAGAAHRLLREHAGAAHGPLGSADVPGIIGPRASACRWRPTITRTCRSRSWWRN